MQLNIQLNVETPVFLPFDYNYKLASNLYHLILKSDEKLGTNIHNGDDFKSRIKLFCFSPLHSKIMEVKQSTTDNGDSGLIFKGASSFRVATPWPELLNALGEGLLNEKEIRVGSQIFQVKDAKLIKPPVFKETMQWKPMRHGSIVTGWSEKQTKKKIYLYPGDNNDSISIESVLQRNLIHKWYRLCEIRQDIALEWSDVSHDVKRIYSEKDITIGFPPHGSDISFRKKLHHIKESPVRSWYAEVKIRAPIGIQRLVYSAGLGQMNSMGFGLVEAF